MSLLSPVSPPLSLESNPSSLALPAGTMLLSTSLIKGWFLSLWPFLRFFLPVKFAAILLILGLGASMTEAVEGLLRIGLAVSPVEYFLDLSVSSPGLIGRLISYYR